MMFNTKSRVFGFSFRKRSPSVGRGSDELRKAKCWKRHNTISPAVITINSRTNK